MGLPGVEGWLQVHTGHRAQEIRKKLRKQFQILANLGDR